MDGNWRDLLSQKTPWIKVNMPTQEYIMLIQLWSADTEGSWKSMMSLESKLPGQVDSWMLYNRLKSVLYVKEVTTDCIPSATSDKNCIPCDDTSCMNCAEVCSPDSADSEGPRGRTVLWSHLLHRQRTLAWCLLIFRIQKHTLTC